MPPWQNWNRNRWSVWFLLLCGGTPSALPAAADPPLTERRRAVEHLSPAAKLELQRQKERFESMPPAEQQRMRELHRELDSHADGEKLRQVMRRYDAWLATLSSAQRAKLLALPADERIEQIREMKRRSEESIFGVITSSRLNREDARLVFDWLDQLAIDHEKELREKLDPRARGWVDRIRDGSRRRSTMLRMLVGKEGPDALPQPTPQQVDQLVQQLSEQAQQRFQTQEDPAQQQRLVQQWIRAALLSRVLPPPVSDEELQRFFVEDLLPEERESLERMPRDLMSHELRRRYFHYQLRRRMPGNEFEPRRGFEPRRPPDEWDRERRGSRGFRSGPPQGPWDSEGKDMEDREYRRRGPPPPDALEQPTDPPAATDSPSRPAGPPR